MPAWPVRIDGKPPRVSASPVLGQHTKDVLTAWLGLSEAEVEQLRSDSVV
jgi:crotonobetainyl-CoA:carnitine CoA-transferase CaiB-like acyl-CoA transferase